MGAPAFYFFFIKRVKNILKNSQYSYGFCLFCDRNMCSFCLSEGCLIFFFKLSGVFSEQASQTPGLWALCWPTINAHLDHTNVSMEYNLVGICV